MLKLLELDPQNFDQVFDPENPRLAVIYFWGINCPNCDYAHGQLDLHAESFEQLPVTYYSVNAYEHTELATRYSLIGIPSFLFVRQGKVLGRVTGFPGFETFVQALQKHSA
jgi:thiol-disulfide isomerase/thioredoxin